MDHPGMSALAPDADTSRHKALHPPEVHKPMPQALIVIFLLFFAVLAAGWFYLQRAKARDAGKASTDSSATTTTDQGR